MTRLMPCAAGLLAMLVGTAVYAETKVGVVGSANPMLIAKTETGQERELYTGDAVFLGERLSTSESGSAQLMFLDRSALIISPNSEVTIDRFVYDPGTELGQMGINASVGAFRFIGGALSKKNPVTIQTPVSTIGIRGGIGDTFIEPAGQTQSVFHHGEAMSMTNAAGVTVVATEPGAGFQQQAATSRPVSLTPQQVSARLSTSPVAMAAGVAPPLSAPQLQQFEQQIGSPLQPSPANQTPVVPEPPATPEPAAQIEQPADESSQSASQAPASDTQSPETETPATPKDAPTLDKPVTGSPISETQLNEIRSNPASVLDNYPQGGPKMARFIGDAIATDPSIAGDLAGAMSGATPAQAAAIGAGFVRSARMLTFNHPEAARYVVDQVSTIDNSNIRRTFQAIGPEIQQIGSHPLPSKLPPSPIPSRPVGSEASAPIKQQIRGLKIPKIQRPAKPETSKIDRPLQDIVDPEVVPATVGYIAVDAAEENDGAVRSISPAPQTPGETPDDIVDDGPDDPDIEDPDDIIGDEPEDNDGLPISP